MATTKEDNKDAVDLDQSHLPLLSLNLGNDFSNSLPQHVIDMIYANEYGELTEQDRHDWILLFCGLHQDMLKIQQEVRMIVPTEAGFDITAPYLVSRFHAAMQERVAALGRGEPIVVEGHAPRMSGRMMTRWIAEVLAGVPWLYHRIEATLVARYLSGDYATLAT